MSPAAEGASWVSGAILTIVLFIIGLKMWMVERENSKLKKDVRDADLSKIEEANRLRDSQSLTERANEYWKRMHGKPPGKDS